MSPRAFSQSSARPGQSPGACVAFGAQAEAVAAGAVDVQLGGDLRLAQGEEGERAAFGERAGIVVGLRDEGRRRLRGDVDLGLQLGERIVGEDFPRVAEHEEIGAAARLVRVVGGGVEARVVVGRGDERDLAAGGEAEEPDAIRLHAEFRGLRAHEADRALRILRGKFPRLRQLVRRAAMLEHGRRRNRGRGTTPPAPSLRAPRRGSRIRRPARSRPPRRSSSPPPVRKIRAAARAIFVRRRIGDLSVGFGSVTVSGPGTVKSPGGLPSHSFQTREGSACVSGVTVSRRAKSRPAVFIAENGAQIRRRAASADVGAGARFGRSGPFTNTPAPSAASSGSGGRCRTRCAVRGDLLLGEARR